MTDSEEETVPTLADARQAAAELFTALSAAGNQSQHEEADGHTHPSETAIELWEDAAEKLMRLVRPVLHLAEGGAYVAPKAPLAAQDASAEANGVDEPVPADDAVPGQYDPEQELTWFHSALTNLEIDVTREQAAAAVAEWHAAMQIDGTPLRFVFTPGWTGLMAARWLVKKNSGAVEPAALISSKVWDISRNRPLRQASWVNPLVKPTAGQWITGLDVNAQFPAAAGTVALGDGEPAELTGAEFARYSWKRLARSPRPGYIHLASDHNLDGTPPHVHLGLGPILHADTWIPMPLATYLAVDHGREFDIDEAVLWDGTHEVKNRRVNNFGTRLKAWKELYCRGRLTLAQRVQAKHDPADLALTILKVSYSAFLGGLLRSPQNHTEWGRPDWSDQIQSLGTANMLRAADKAHDAGFHDILGGLKDQIWVVGDEPNLTPPEITISTLDSTPPSQPGKFKHDRLALVDDAILDAVEKGGAGALQTAIITGDQQRKAT